MCSLKIDHVDLKVRTVCCAFEHVDYPNQAFAGLEWLRLDETPHGASHAPDLLKCEVFLHLLGSEMTRRVLIKLGEIDASFCAPKSRQHVLVESWTVTDFRLVQSVSDD